MVNKAIKKFILPSLAAIVGASIVVATRVFPTSFILTDGNSTAEFDNSVDGFYDWTVNGTNQLYQMSTFFKTDALNFCDSGFVLIETPGCLENGVLTQNTADTASITYTYQDPDTKTDLFVVILDYDLNGGGTKGFLSSLRQKVTINNLSANPYNFEVINYYNLELGGDLGGDKASIDPTSPFPGLQVDNDGDLSVEGTVYATIKSNTVNSIPDAYEVSFPGDLLNPVTGITGPGFTAPQNNTGPVTGDGFEEPAIAYRPINESIPGGGTAMGEQTVALETVEIPEPSALIGLGGFVLSALGLSRNHDNQDNNLS
ncbi:hypothetical protein [Crocosphaera chwakensis]|uniref:EF hand domain/PKD domain protein n=1 Tax=Crocosphaera chwakensis CCY0110 TaxID=391612 RepID=A3IWQ2_9CHRO|nr:hypothetical protein [Crocosphaera chwakensis]EAZ89107.1 EF hand domain/PKD domain protein [Crocosphaera chwakensis CCY0110]